MRGESGEVAAVFSAPAWWVALLKVFILVILLKVPVNHCRFCIFSVIAREKPKEDVFFQVNLLHMYVHCILYKKVFLYDLLEQVLR